MQRQFTLPMFSSERSYLKTSFPLLNNSRLEYSDRQKTTASVKASGITEIIKVMLIIKFFRK